MVTRIHSFLHHPTAAMLAISGHRITKMVEGSIMSRQEFNEFVITKMHYGEADRERWTKDNHGDHTLQISIACGIHLRCLWLNINDDSLHYFRSMNPRQTAMLSQVWEQELIAKIASGKP